MDTHAIEACCRDLRTRIGELTPWEAGFLGSLDARPRAALSQLTPLQIDKLREIHARLFANPPGGLNSTEEDLWR